jgi:hypothetical protein
MRDQLATFVIFSPAGSSPSASHALQLSESSDTDSVDASKFKFDISPEAVARRSKEVKFHWQINAKMTIELSQKVPADFNCTNTKCGVQTAFGHSVTFWEASQTSYECLDVPCLGLHPRFPKKSGNPTS